MKMNIEELETADYDILENIKVAFYRLWKMKIVVLLMTLIGFLACGVQVLKHLILLQHPFTVQCMDHMRIPWVA